MLLQATVTSSLSPAPLQDSVELFSAGIPGAGISVPNIFKLGATLAYEVGTSATFAGSATVDFGLAASLPNNAKVVADINNPTSSLATGWKGASLTPTLEVTKLSASLTLAAFSKPKLSFGIELIKVGQVDVALTMKLPEISSTLSAEYGTFCCRSTHPIFPITWHKTATLLIRLQCICISRSQGSLLPIRRRLQNRNQARKQSRRISRSRDQR